MTFKEALEKMKLGYTVKRPHWAGYWQLDAKNEVLNMHTKEGKVIEIRETDRLLYTLENIAADDWIVAAASNTPILGGTALFDFGETIKLVKRGLKLSRKGWNGKGQYISIAVGISYIDLDDTVKNADHDAMGNKAIVFNGTSGTQVGWLASQSDMLAEDWYVID